MGPFVASVVLMKHSDVLSQGRATPAVRIFLISSSNHRHSFAVISVGTERQETFRAAEDYLLRFFREGSTAEKMASQAIVPEIGGARALLGFNTPSPAKQLFRYRHGHPMQPTVAASSSLAAVFDHLRGVVDVATDIILSPVGLNVAALRKQWFVPQADESLSATYSSPLDCFYYSNTVGVEFGVLPLIAASRA